jgi:hypothetical protein
MKLVKIIMIIISTSHDLMIFKLNFNWGKNTLNDLLCLENDDNDDG